MRLLHVVLPWLLFLWSGLAEQTLLSQLPTCAVKCFKATLPATGCSSSDISCLCTDTNFMTTAAACNSVNCTMVEYLQATNQTYAACGVAVRDQTATLIGTTASFGAMALLMVGLRLIDRGLSRQAKLGWDDVLIGLSGFSSIIMNVPVLVGAAYGFGRDIWGMTPDQITNSLHWLWVAYPLYMTTEAFCQLSILAFYLRIMTDRTQRRIVWGLMGFVAAFGLSNFFAMVFQCWPIHFFWDGWRGEMVADSQINMNLFSFIRGGLEIALDLVILALPLPMLAKLQMSRKKKMQIMSMFCVGFVITGVSCARLHALIQFAATTNPTYDNTSGIYWCMIEANLFIIVACMPAIHAVLHKAWSNGTSRNSSAKASYFNNSSEHNRRQKSGSLPFGVISKSTDVKVYHTHRSDRSESDVELVDQGDRPGQMGSDDGKSVGKY